MDTARTYRRPLLEYIVSVSLWLCSIAVASCHQRAPQQNQVAGPGAKSAAIQDQCPDGEIMELLHSVIFHVEQFGPSPALAKKLGQLQKLVGEDENMNGRLWAQRFLSRIEGALARVPIRIDEIETIRAEFHESRCLNANAHPQWHLRIKHAP